MSLPAKAQDLSGTLHKIRETKTITLGVQETSIPFSYLDGNQQAVGYSVDLCLGIADAIKKKLGFADLAIQRVPGNIGDAYSAGRERDNRSPVRLDDEQ